MVADVLPVSPPVAAVAVVVSSVWVVTSEAVAVGDGALVVREVVGAVDEDVWEVLVLSVMAGEVIVDASVLPVVPVVRCVSGVESVLVLLGIVSFSVTVGRSAVLVSALVGIKVVESAEEKASRKHARVAKVAAMVLLLDTKQAGKTFKTTSPNALRPTPVTGKLRLTSFRIRNLWHYSPPSQPTEPALGLLEDLRGPKVSAVCALVGADQPWHCWLPGRLWAELVALPQSKLGVIVSLCAQATPCSVHIAFYSPVPKGCKGGGDGGGGSTLPKSYQNRKCIFPVRLCSLNLSRSTCCPEDLETRQSTFVTKLLLLSLARRICDSFTQAVRTACKFHIK